MASPINPSPAKEKKKQKKPPYWIRSLPTPPPQKKKEKKNFPPALCRPRRIRRTPRRFELSPFSAFLPIGWCVIYCSSAQRVVVSKGVWGCGGGAHWLPPLFRHSSTIDWLAFFFFLRVALWSHCHVYGRRRNPFRPSRRCVRGHLCDQQRKMRWVKKKKKKKRKVSTDSFCERNTRS